MKHPEEFSDEAVRQRSMKAAQELAVAARSAKVKRELDAAQMVKKERRPLKEFTDLRTEISEHVGVSAHSMPPNILILQRKTIRQFPNNVMVALYYNEKLGQYFSIPYGGVAPDEAVITPVALKEEVIQEEAPLHQIGDTVSYLPPSANVPKRGKITKLGADHVIVHRKSLSGKSDFHYKVPHIDIIHNSRSGDTQEIAEAEELNEISKETLGGYVGKASSDLYGKGQAIGWLQGTPITREGDAKERQRLRNKASHRFAGIAQATKKLAKAEELNELSLKTMRQAHADRTNKGYEELAALGLGSHSSKDQLSSRMKAHGHFVKAAKTDARMKKKFSVGVDDLREEIIQEDVISHLQKVRDFKTSKPLYHKDGSQTRIDPTTANALLTVHGALHPDNRKKFSDALEHSKGKFNRMLDFSWKNVK